MSTAGPPPAQPPQLSPDRKWVWDGMQWRPLAVHEAVFPSWSSVGAGIPTEVTQQAPPQRRQVLSPPPMPSPAAAYYVPANEPEPAPPAWIEQPRAGINYVLYIVAGFIVLVLAGVALTNFLPGSLPWDQSSASLPTAAPTVPITDYTERGLADRLVNAVLAPPMADLNQSLGVVGESCTGPVTLSCEEALSNTDKQIHKVLGVIDREYAPDCIAPKVAALRADLVKLDAATLLALKGAKEGNTSELGSGLSQVGASRNQVQGDESELRNAVKSTACSLPRTEPTA